MKKKPLKYLLGRVGDSPLVGHGVFADNESAAISCTGTGQLYTTNNNVAIC